MNFSSLFKAPKKQSRLKSKQVLTTNIPALHLPEILSLIFSFLSQRTLSASVRFVCKQWLAVARPMIHVQALWKDRTHPKYSHRFLLNHLHTVTHLRVLFEQIWSLNNTQYAWRELGETIDSLRESNRLRIRKLILNRTNFLESRIYPILSKITTLTEIHIERMVQRNIHLGVILALCPSLRRLYIEYPENLRLIEDNTTPPWSGTESGFKDSGIEALIIKGMNVEQDTLEAIIRRCPNLRVLKLAGLVQNSSYLLSYDRAQLYNTVAASCPMLKCFHFSLQGEYMDRKEAKALIDTFFPGAQSPKLNFMDTDNQYRKSLQKPMLSTLSIADADIRTENISHLFLPFGDSFFNQILTTLEVEPTIGTDYHDVGYILHDFLCTAPALLHVIAPTIPCYAEYLDLANTVPGEEEYCIPRNCRLEQQIPGQFRFKKRMWACRGLQTLKIQFKSMIADSPSAENARIMFGYIARTCPKLRVLSIYRQDLDLKLDGGFCLLTKLERLERLMIQTDSKTLLKLKDVEWMARFPKKAKLPWLGNSRSTTSVHSISGHSSASVRRNNSTTSKSSNGSGCHNSEPRELTFDELGKVEDVDACRRQLSISQGELGCWPMLEFLGIQVGRYKNERGETVKDNLKTIIENIRPDIEFSMDASRW